MIIRIKTLFILPIIWIVINVLYISKIWKVIYIYIIVNLRSFKDVNGNIPADYLQIKKLKIVKRNKVSVLEINI